MFTCLAISAFAGGNQAQGAGSSATPAVSPVAGKSIVRVGIANDPGTLAPFAPMSGGGIAVRRTIYEFLIDRNSFGGEMIGTLMKSYQKVDDVTYNMTLYDNIHDAAGNNLTAQDVKFSYDTAKASGNLPKLSVIASVTVVDNYTASFKFNAPLALGDLEAIWSEAPIVTEVAYKASPDKMATTPVGTTAYRVTEFVAGSKITMTRTKNYWQTDTSKMPLDSQSNVDVIEFHIIRESAQIVVALETGAIDITVDVQNSTQAKPFIPGGQNSANFNAYMFMNNPITMLLFNCSNGKPFANNAPLRQAIAYAIDAKGLAEGVYGAGFGIPLKTLGSNKYGDYNKAWDNDAYYEYDLNKAKTLLSQAGYGSNGPTLTLLCLNQEVWQNSAAIIQGYLSQIGITVKIAAYESAMYTTLLNDSTAYDFALNIYGSTDYLVNVWKLPLLGTNYNGHTVNFVVDSQLQTMLGNVITVAGHTQANVNTLNSYLKDNLYAYGLNTNAGYVLSNKRVTNVKQDSRNQIVPGACAYDFSR
jgi:ABC-type transport system substrate-binding protein